MIGATHQAQAGHGSLDLRTPQTGGEQVDKRLVLSALWSLDKPGHDPTQGTVVWSAVRPSSEARAFVAQWRHQSANSVLP